MKLAEIFQDGMVLQQKKPVHVFGEAKPGEKVYAEIQSQKASAVAGPDRRFEIVFDGLAASREEELTVAAERESITLTHVAVGEVWIAGGQSNMEFFMEFEKHIDEERPQCENPDIRFYDVPEVAMPGQREAFDYSLTAVWRQATQEDIGYFSAVGYYFQKEIARDLSVPVGIIGCNWGGSRSVAWMSIETANRCGSLWMDDYHKRMDHVDLSRYYEEQNKSPMNNRGALIHDPFTAFMLPRTPSAEEVAAFFANSGAVDLPVSDELQPHVMPGALYEHMLKTIAGYTVRGVLWYQGESDDELEGGQKIYDQMLSGMIGDWRALWKEELPFLIVQLPGWQEWLAIKNNDYMDVRACQERVTKLIPGTWLCSVSDAGEQYDIHPKDKKVVGERLALLARGHVYGEDLLCDAPVVSKAERNGSQLVLTFDHAGEGLYVEDDAWHCLKVTQGDASVSYTAEVRGDQLVLQLHEAASGTVTAALAWEPWYLVHLYNSAGIPAIPFRIQIGD